MSALSWRSSFLILVFLMVRGYAARTPDRFDSTSKMASTHSIPVLEVVESVEQPNSVFTGVLHRNYKVYYEGDFKLSPEEEQLSLSWEEAWPGTGKRVDQFIRLRQTKKSTQTTNEREDGVAPEHIKSRNKRKIFYTDNRYLIPLKVFGNRFPFASVVKLSTGCTGTLISPKHVLTAAHCIHNQSDYVAGFENLKAGLLPDFRVSRKFDWIRVKESFLPNGWLMGNPNIASRFDYALLELEETHSKPYFELAISEGKTRAIIHFTAYEDDKPTNTLWYRACRVKVTDEHVLYHHCDAQPGSSGAGVYTWSKVGGEWNRRLIGVFSGYRWKSFKEWWKKDADFNAAIRLNTLKYTQICRWMGKYAGKSCKELKNSSG